MEKIALIDMDGTIADYDRRMTEELTKLLGPNESLEFGYGDDAPTHVKERQKLIKRQPGFWRNLPRLEAGFEIVDEIRSQGFELHVLTKGPQTTVSAWTEKVEWCHENIPDAAITITQDKSLVYGRILVDDWAPFFTGWLAHRPNGLVICVEHPWNKNIDHPQVLIYDGSIRSRALLRNAIYNAGR